MLCLNLRNTKKNSRPFFLKLEQRVENTEKKGREDEKDEDSYFHPFSLHPFDENNNNKKTSTENAF